MLLAFLGLSINSASAQFGGGNGTPTDPYQIATGGQLAQLATFVNGADVSYSDKCYILTADIDLCAYNAANTAFNGGKGWIPIGIGTYGEFIPFKGVFDGNGKKITGLYMNDIDRIMCSGLFGNVTNATIKNVMVVNASVHAFDAVGGIAGMATESAISNCYVSGNVSGRDAVGGVTGLIGQVELSNCYSAVNVNGSRYGAGGISGGILGEGSITNCYSTGVVVGEVYAGGIVGDINLATGATKVSNCAALNPCVKGQDGTNEGRIVGRNEGGTLTNNVAFKEMLNTDGNTTWTHTGGNDLDGEDITKQTINTDGTLGNRFVAANGWTIENGKLPGLFNNTVEMPLHLMNCAGTSSDPFIITTADYLAQLAALVNSANGVMNNKCYKLANDIDLSNYGACFNGGKGWISIGWYDYDNHITNPFKGAFDGNNKKITGLYLDDGDLDYAGLFGIVFGGTVKNVGVENVNISGYFAVGGVAGGVYNSSITDCYSTGKISGKYQCVGGVVGDFDGASVTNCYSTVDVSGYGAIGGVLGGGVTYTVTTTITNCYSTGNVSGTWSVGGVMGGATGCTISNCYSTGKASGTDHGVGGVAGYVCHGSISNCYSTGNVSGINYSVGGVVGYADLDCSITNCYSTGDVSGNNDVGGVVGIADDGCNVTNCYSTGAVSGNERVGGVAGYIYNSSISNCAALNPSVKGNSDVGRVVGYLDGTGNTLTNNIAFDGILNKAGNTTWSDKGLTKLDGEDMTKETINTDGTLGGRFNAPAWTTQKGSLPGLFGNTVVMPLHLRIPGMVYITTTSLPDGKVGVSYSETLTADGYTPITWSVIANTLPLGLTLDPTTGEISGTPTTKGPFTFTVKAVNSVGDDSKTLTITIGDGVGIESITNDELRVYPNPTTGELKIENGKLKIENVEIFDVMGRKAPLNPPEGGRLPSFGGVGGGFDISHLPSGIYFVRIQTETGVITQKIIKQ